MNEMRERERERERELTLFEETTARCEQPGRGAHPVMSEVLAPYVRAGLVTAYFVKCELRDEYDYERSLALLFDEHAPSLECSPTAPSERKRERERLRPLERERERERERSGVCLVSRKRATCSMVGGRWSCG